MNAHNIPERNSCRDFLSMIGISQAHFTLCGDEMKGMDEIGVGSILDAIEDGMPSFDDKIVPSHMGDFQCRIGRIDLDDIARNPIQPMALAMFPTPGRQQLHANADSEERDSPFLHSVPNRLDESLSSLEAAKAIGKCANSRKNQPVCIHDRCRAIGNQHGF